MAVTDKLGDIFSPVLTPSRLTSLDSLEIIGFQMPGI